MNIPDRQEAMTLGDRIAVLNAGKLQQVGAPQELYDRPANTFVAGFFGNPGMNIFDATLNRETATLQLAGGAWQIPSEPLLAGKVTLLEQMHRPLLAGLRPEMFSTSASGAEVRVESIESLGHECLVHFTPLCAVPGRNRNRLVARLPGPAVVRAGQTIRLGFDPQLLQLFTPEGDAIHHSREQYRHPVPGLTRYL